MAWVTYEGYRPGPARFATPQLIVYKNWEIGVTGPAWELLGQADYVTLHYEPDRHLIGLRAATAETPFALKLRHYGKGRTAEVAARGFCAQFGISTPQRVYLLAQLDRNTGILAAGPAPGTLPSVAAVREMVTQANGSGRR